MECHSLTVCPCFLVVIPITGVLDIGVSSQRTLVAHLLSIDLFSLRFTTRLHIARSPETLQEESKERARGGTGIRVARESSREIDEATTEE
jgi:hypothetical protein